MKKIIQNPSLTYEGELLNFDNIFLDYPNPKCQRVPFILLNGRYRLEINKSSKIPSSFKENVMVPYPLSSLLSGVKEAPKKNLHYHYHFNFEIVDNFMKDKVFINILRIDGSFTIFINGKKIYSGSDEIFLRKEIRDALDVGNNSLDIDFTKTGKYLGITGQIYLDTTDASPIEHVKINTSLSDQSVTFQIESNHPNGIIRIISPNGISKEYNFSSNKTTLYLDDIVEWNPINPFFYSYEIITMTDKVKGLFSLINTSLGYEKNIPCLLLNNKPLSIKGILDDYYYPDGVITMPSFNHSSKMIKEIKKMGFNGIYIENRIELPYFYYNLEINGILSIVRIDSYDIKNTIQKINYLSDYDINICFIIDNHIKTKTNEELYKIYKPYLDNKILVVRSRFSKDYGDIKLIKNLNELKRNKKNKCHKLLLSMEYKNDISVNYLNYLNEDYIKDSINGLVGFYLSSLNNPKTGLFTPDFRKRNNGSKMIIEYEKNLNE